MSEIPSYSSEPGPDEHRLAVASQNIPTATASGTLVQRSSGSEIALYNRQLDTAQHATYGRGAALAGEVSVVDHTWSHIGTDHCVLAPSLNPVA